MYKPDYETNFSILGSTQISTERITSPKAVGAQALKVNKTGEKEFFIISSIIKKARIKKEGTYLLFAYARKYGQISKAMLAEYDQSKWPPSSGYLNPYIGKFKVPESDLSWQMVFILLPVEKGEHSFQEIIHVAEKTSYFDGFQTFILVP